jgi:hypothetical protein
MGRREIKEQIKYKILTNEAEISSSVNVATSLRV